MLLVAGTTTSATPGSTKPSTVSSAEPSATLTVPSPVVDEDVTSRMYERRSSDAPLAFAGPSRLDRLVAPVILLLGGDVRLHAAAVQLLFVADICLHETTSCPRVQYLMAAVAVVGENHHHHHHASTTLMT